MATVFADALAYNKDKEGTENRLINGSDGLLKNTVFGHFSTRELQDIMFSLHVAINAANISDSSKLPIPDLTGWDYSNQNGIYAIRSWMDQLTRRQACYGKSDQSLLPGGQINTTPYGAPDRSQIPGGRINITPTRAAPCPVAGQTRDARGNCVSTRIRPAAPKMTYNFAPTGNFSFSPRRP
jgi:hypothetical protein